MTAPAYNLSTPDHKIERETPKSLVDFLNG